MLSSKFRNKRFRTVLMAVLAFVFCVALILLTSAQTEN